MDVLFYVKICEGIGIPKGFTTTVNYPVLFISNLPEEGILFLIPNDDDKFKWVDIKDTRFVRKD